MRLGFRQRFAMDAAVSNRGIHTLLDRGLARTYGVTLPANVTGLL